MKKVFVLCMLMVILLSDCTDNQRARSFGGKETINLPKGQRLVNATWKNVDLWYVTEPMPADYEPTIKTFQEKSQYGMMEGKITFVESK